LTLITQLLEAVRTNAAGAFQPQLEGLLGGVGKRLVKLLVGAPSAIAPVLTPALGLCHVYLEKMASPVHAELPDGVRLFGMTALRFLVEAISDPTSPNPTLA